MFYMRMPLKIFSENQISNQFPHILESISLIIFQLKPALLFHASNLLYFLLKKNKSCSYQTWKERKLIIFESKLLDLIQFCPSCSAHMLCSMQREFFVQWSKSSRPVVHAASLGIWESQPMIGSVPAGNLILSAALLMTDKIYISVYI